MNNSEETIENAGYQSDNSPQAEVEAAKPAPDVSRVREEARSQAEAEILARLVANPDMRKVMDAQQKGRKIHVLDDDEIAQAKPMAPEPTEAELNDLPPAKLAERIISQTTSALSKLIEEKLRPVQERMNAVEGTIQKETRGKLDTEIKSLRDKYADFDGLRDDMVQMSNQVNGGLSPEELYKIVKMRRGEGIPTPRQVESERPTSEGHQPASREKSRLGAAGAADMIADALRKHVRLPKDRT